MASLTVQIVCVVSKLDFSAIAFHATVGQIIWPIIVLGVSISLVCYLVSS